MKSIDGILQKPKHNWLKTAPTRGWLDDKLKRAFLIIFENDEPIMLSEDIEDPNDKLWADWFANFENNGIITL